ncbi:MAG: hypothetical protein AB1589_43110, partial [Cyanobacteriota bacterium]
AAEGTISIKPNIISITPKQGTVGSLVTVRGNGYGAGTIVKIDFGTTLTIQASSTYEEGSFTTTFTVDTQPYGITTIKARGDESASGTYTILPNIILITPGEGTLGTIVTVRGNGFTASKTIRIDFGTIGTIQLTSSYGEGSFTTTFTVDTQPYGITTVKATDSDNVNASGTFTIKPVIISVVPATGTVGEVITIRGTGYHSQERLRIDFGTSRTIQMTSSDVEGSFTTTFTINTQPYGITTITVYGTEGISSCGTLTILPKIILISPGEGTVGKVISIRGNGFNASEQVRLAFGTTRTIQLTSTDAEGSWTTTWTIDTQPYGTTSIRAYGANIDAEGTLTILPAIIVISPKEGTVGSIVSVAGNGYSARELVHIIFGTCGTITMTSSDGIGSFSTTFTVNTQSLGTTTIIAVGMISGMPVLEWEYKIVPKLVYVTPDRGTVGTIVTLQGSGYLSNEEVRIGFGRTQTITTTFATPEGSFTTTFTIDTQPYGSTTIIAEGVSSRGSAQNLSVLILS